MKYNEFILFQNFHYFFKAERETIWGEEEKYLIRTISRHQRISLFGGGDVRRGGGYSFVACLSNLTTDHASLSRRRTVPTPNGDTSNIWAPFTLFPYIT